MDIIRELPSFAALLPAQGRLIGLDLGEKTIGIATSDERRTIASGQITLSRTKQTKDIAALGAMMEGNNVAGIVLGYPVNMDGSEGPRCQSTRAFARSLWHEFFLPILLWDERMTTMVVNRVMEKEADLSRAKRAEHVDKLAATYLLQGVLDSLCTIPPSFPLPLGEG